jgi:hypothetical protein
LVFLHATYSNAQSIDLTTGNIINTTSWTGVTYTNSAGVSQCCSGGPNPAINQDTNTIRFSYGYMAAAQSIALSKIFEPLGTGIKVTGYNYSWQINNEGYNSGPLYANVGLVGKNGNLLESYNYDYNRYIPGFETFTGTQKFSVDYGVPSLNSLEVKFIGSDTRFWAGYYGPRGRDVNVTMNYQFDTSKPTAPITLPTITTYVDTITNSIASSGLNATTQGLPEVVQQTVAAGGTVNFDGQIQSSNPQQSMPVQQQVQQQQVQQAQQQMAGSPVVVAAQQEKTSAAGPGTGFALSLIAKNNDREKAIAQQVVASAIGEAQSVGDKAQQIATSTAQQAVVMSTINMDTNFSGQGLQLSSQTSRTSTQIQITQQGIGNIELLTNQNFQTSTTIQQNFSQQLLQPVTIEQLQNTQNYSIFNVQEYKAQEAEQPQQTSNFLTDLNNPLKQIIEQQQVQQQFQDSPQVAQKREQPKNDLETGVNLAQMATQPQGYASYTNFVLRDTQFYDAKPIYQNQKVIDNVRVLRGLGSDQKHQQMVQDQYR